ncbi:hypothetical protein [Leucobacter denitrificans]|uniref:Lipoprotein n=1 Tax=Leucobacter denitrificans TaxID=683042 RepID=A0A7G9S5Z1_9MICO|nr:hypothetical protein [Leucobacter denitrificans]QNN63266.1 hypothetical protein H9L06_02670 [Leucobacter denitrificans]
MSTISRITATTTALLASALLVAGCASSADDAETDPVTTPEETTPGTAGDNLDFDIAWLDNGRMVAIVTDGSSSCVPVAETVTTGGQTVTVELSEGESDQACTADLVPRASLVALPQGIDPTADVKFNVTLGSATGDEDLDGNSALTGTPGDSTDYAPSAGWFDDDALVLLTWGSSTCPPVIDTVEASGNAGTVQFVTEERACTMDMTPRATIVDFGDIEDGDDGSPFVLTLVGDGLDAKLEVIDN